MQPCTSRLSIPPPDPPCAQQPRLAGSLTPPRLAGCTTAHFIAFQHARAEYERNIARRNALFDTPVLPVTLRDSISPTVLQLMLLGDLLRVDSVAEVSEQLLRDTVAQHARVAVEDYDLVFIDRKIKHVTLPRYRRGAALKDRVWALFQHYIETLSRFGYAELVRHRQKLAVKQLMDRITHAELHARLMNAMAFSTAGDVNFKRFFQLALNKAQEIDDYYISRPRRARADPKSRRAPLPVDKHSRRIGKPNLPKCLNPDCAGYHLISRCPASTKEQKHFFRSQFRAAKRRCNTPSVLQRLAFSHRVEPDCLLKNAAGRLRSATCRQSSFVSTTSAMDGGMDDAL